MKLKSYNLDPNSNVPNYKIKLLPPSSQCPIESQPNRATINININSILINSMNASASLNIGKDFLSVPLSNQQSTTLPAETPGAGHVMTPHVSQPLSQVMTPPVSQEETTEEIPDEEFPVPQVMTPPVSPVQTTPAAP